MRTHILSDAEKAEFAERGYWISPVLFDATEIANLRDAVTRVCSNQPDPDTRYWLGCGPATPAPAGRAMVQIVNAWWVNQVIRQVVTAPEIGQIGAQFMATSEVRLWHDQAIYKPGLGADGGAEKAGNVGWHQDYAHWQCASTDNFVTAWIALQDTDLHNGGMRTIVGSHKWGLAADAYTFGEKDLAALEARFKREDRPWLDEPCIMKAGQVSFHHSLTFHGSGPNLSDAPRLSLIAHMMPADCAVNANGRHHQNLDLLGPDKRPGDLFAGPNFPVLWRAPGG